MSQENWSSSGTGWIAGDRETREEEVHPNAEIVTRIGGTEHRPEGLSRWFPESEEQFDE